MGKDKHEQEKYGHSKKFVIVDPVEVITDPEELAATIDEALKANDDLTATNPSPKEANTMDTNEVKTVQPKEDEFPFLFTNPDNGEKVMACTKGQAWRVIGCGSKEQLNMMVDAGKITKLGYKPSKEGSAQPVAVYEWESVLRTKANYHPRGVVVEHRFQIWMTVDDLIDSLDELIKLGILEEDGNPNGPVAKLIKALQKADDLTKKGSDKRKEGRNG